MALRNVCHRCRHKWKVKGNQFGQSCPKCGHDNVGPTDPTSSLLPMVIVVGATLAGGAWYTGLLGGSTSVEDLKQQVEDAAQDLSETIEEQTGGDAPEPRSAPEPAPARDPEPAAEPARATREPAPAAEPPARPEVVVAGSSGAALASSYLVKGRIKNTGSVSAAGIVVVVTYRDAAGEVLAEVEAECPRVLDGGKTARYESALSGAKAERVDRFDVAVRFD